MLNVLNTTSFDIEQLIFFYISEMDGFKMNKFINVQNTEYSLIEKSGKIVTYSTETKLVHKI